MLLSCCVALGGLGRGSLLHWWTCTLFRGRLVPYSGVDLYRIHGWTCTLFRGGLVPYLGVLLDVAGKFAPALYSDFRVLSSDCARVQNY